MATVKQPQSDDGIDHSYDIEPRFVSDEEWWAMFDAEARRMFGMSADEFVAAWKAGDLSDEAKFPHGEVVHLLLMWPDLEYGEP